MTSKAKAEELLSLAGITIDGLHPWDIQVKDERLYDRVIAGGTLALGESYMDGWWDVDDLAEFFNKVLGAKLDQQVKPFSMVWQVLKSKLINMQSPSRATIVAEQHYDLGNDLYQKMLGRSMAYTCAYWKEANNLDDAQEAKFDLICRKVGLKKGDHILDIGCGFGAFAKYAAEKYGASVVGTSVSKQQIEFAREYTKGLPVEIRFEDYRETKGQFDHIISIGMFEAVGHKNFRVFMEKAHTLLKEEGFFLLHTIGANWSETMTDPWIDKYIFPNGHLPSIKQLGASIEKLFVMEDWHNFGPYYDKTLQAWFKNFDATWAELKEKYGGDRFYRMWKYYLMCSAGSFRCRNNQLWQIVLSKNGVPGGYSSVR